MTLALNQLAAISVTILSTWSGAWIADVDVDLDPTAIVPSGKVLLTVGTATLSGTVDPTANGRFATHARVRVVGGGNGWSQPTKRQHFHNDAGVLNTAVIAATAAEVGEVAVVATPLPLGIDWTRMAGPASRVFKDLSWYVDFLGVTQVAPRVPTPAPPDVEVLEWNGLWQTAKIASDTLVVPGMVLTDTRFGTVTVRDVEQTFTAAGGARATAWCGAASRSRLAAALTTIAQEATAIVYARSYKYRVVLQGVDGRLTLQAVTPTLGVPDQLPISVWYGLPGAKGKPALGSLCILEFNEGDPSQPMVRAFDSAIPLQLDIETSALLNLKAPLVSIGEAPQSGVATLQTMTPLFVALNTLVTALNALVGSPNATALAAGTALDPSGSLSSAITAAASALEALLPSPANFSTTVAAAS